VTYDYPRSPNDNRDRCGHREYLSSRVGYTAAEIAYESAEMARLSGAYPDRCKEKAFYKNRRK
jgi:hypothetical protein